MSRLVWPYLFTLRAGNLAGASTNPNFAAVRDNFFPSSNGTDTIALRWSSAPDLGFPRQPFQVYRRVRDTMEATSLTTVLANRTILTGATQTFPTLPGGDLAFLVLAEVAVPTTDSVTLQAIDVTGAPIPNQAVTLTQNGVAEFRCPGIAALTATGSGIIALIRAVGENLYASLPDWTLIQTVGLPLLNNEIGSSYNTQPQGFWPNPLTPPSLNGEQAAIDRTEITALLEMPLPATGIADFPLPAWPQLAPDAYVASIRSAGNIVPMIERCLEHSIDTNPNQMQAAYSETVTTEGLSQIGAAASSPASAPSQVSLPVTDVVMLAVTTDPYAAVGLGYGTLDIPPGTDTSKVAVTMAPTSASVTTGQTQQFTATVTGATNTTVVWSVNGVSGGNATLGTVSSAGLYTAPGAVPDTSLLVVIATSILDPSKSGAATVTITAATTPSGPPIPKPPVPPVPPVAAEVVITQPPPLVLPPADQYGNFDYMVTVPFVFPFGLRATLAALSTGQLPVAAPADLTSALSQVNAPLERDQPAPAAIRITWDAAPVAQGYAILASRASNQSEVLNEPRPAAVGGYSVFVGLPPVNPDPNSPPDQQNPAFSDVDCSLPLAAPPVNNRYLVAAQDIFGQWSAWAATSTTLSPAPVTKPGLRNTEFLYTANSGSPPSPVVPATLRIDFGWNWEDRAPGQIRFTGQFVPAPVTSLNPPYLSGFATSNSAPPGPPLILTFSYSGVNPDTVNPLDVIPTITSGQTSNGPVAIQGEGSPPAPASPNQIQYEVEISGFELDFASSSEIDFLLYATATEEVQPGVWSSVDDQPSSSADTSPPSPPLLIGKIVRAFNPNPPVVTFGPPPISWTALPDATGVARGLLQWQPDPTAAGYYVWEATESALLHLLPPGSPGGTPDAPQGTPYPVRATTLKNLLDTWQDASLQGFARLTQDPILGSSTEITVPGAADTLYVYRISAIGQNNVESARSSSVAIFAVPHRNVPGTPRILQRSAGSPAGLEVIVLPVESSAVPAGYRLFRVRSLALAQNGSTMGPAKYDENSPLWQNYSSTTLAGNLLVGMSILDTAAVPSWYPYYYRATAIGANDPANGAYSGESPYSSVQTGYVLPADAPLIESFAVSISAAKTAALVTLTTDLPAADASPVGGALVELLQLVPASPPGPLKLEQIAAVEPNLIAAGTLGLPASPPASISFARSAPDANGRWTLFMLMPYRAAEAGSFILRLTDPLARQSTASF